MTSERLLTKLQIISEQLLTNYLKSAEIRAARIGAVPEANKRESVWSKAKAVAAQSLIFAMRNTVEQGKKPPI